MLIKYKCMKQIKPKRVIPTLAVTLIIACSFLLALPPTIANAQNTSEVIGRGFEFSNDQGKAASAAIVSSKTNYPDVVELATAKNSSHTIGVIDDKPLVAISSKGKSTQVVLNGATEVLVCDINGPIRAGDKIAASPVAGVGMLAAENGQVVGTAQKEFNTKTAKIRSIKDSKGVGRNVRFGSIPVEVSVAYYQLPGSNFLPPLLQNLANTIADRPVSAIRILVSSLMLMFGFIYVGILIYTTVRTSVISLGRNPLAAHNIRNGLLQMAVLAVTVLLATLLATYLMLSI